MTSLDTFCGRRQIALTRVRDYPQAIDPAPQGRPKLRAYAIQKSLHELEPWFALQIAFQGLDIPRLLHP